MQFLQQLFGSLLAILKQLIGGPPQPAPRAPPADPLDQPLFMLSPVDAFIVRHACNGISIMGGIGSGKTSGSGQTIAHAFLRAGFGGLVMCAKPEERGLWERYAAETGRSDDLVIFGPNQPWRYNFINHQLQMGSGGLIENVVALLGTITDLAKGKQSQGGGDPFWDRGMQMVVRNSAELLYLANGSLSLNELRTFVSDAPRSAEEVASEEWQQNSRCAEVILNASANVRTPQEQHGFEVSKEFILGDYAAMGQRTRSSIEATLLSVIDQLLHGVAYELLSTTTNLELEDTYRQGKILVLDLPIQTYHETGLLVQQIAKYMWQRTVLDRDVTQYPRPVFLWADEAQNFMSSFDFRYQAVARSARACTVYLTQNISNYYSVLGSQGRDEAHSFLGNLVTKIFHANSDDATNQFAAAIIGQSYQTLYNFNSSQNGKQPGSSMSGGGSQSLQYKILPAQFTTLRTGGPANNLQVDGIVFQGGRVFRATGDTFLKAVFSQR